MIKFVLFAFLITAISSAFAKSTEEEDCGANDLLWLKRLVGVPMVLLAAVYGYSLYVNGATSMVPFIRGLGWANWGIGLSSRMVVNDNTYIEKVAKSWSNQMRSFGMWVGFLTIAIHTGYLAYTGGIDALFVDYEFVDSVVRHVTLGGGDPP